MKYCQGTKCHEYRTKDRIRGTKGNKHYQTRRRTHLLFGLFCSQRCEYDWVEKFGDKAIDHFGRVTVTSCYRSPELCVAIGSSLDSQHTRAEAVDFECMGTSNAEVFDWIKANLDWDQMILEFYTPGEPNSGWVHCSWVAENPRKQLLRAYREDGKTRYKPIIGNAVDLS